MGKQKVFSLVKVTGLILALLALLIGGRIGLYGQDQNTDILRVRARRGDTIDSMDPAFHTGNEEYNINLAIFSHLMRYKPGSSDLVLDAAESVDVSEDGKVVTFKLKEGIQFHKGYGEMTAEDVKFSFERIIDPEVDSPYKSDWKTLDHVEVTGKYSGKIILKKPLASLFTSTIPYTSGAIISKKAYEELGEKFATNPVGSGPYYWKDWQPGQRIILERFDAYYGDKPDFKRIEIYPIEDIKASEVAFDRGELDETSVSLDAIDRYESQPDVVVHQLTTLRYHWLGFNVTKEPFDDLRVRKAVRYAVNVDEILAGAYQGIASRNDCMLPPAILGYWEDCPRYEPDLEKAKELLEEAGYPDGFETQIITAQPQYQINAAQIVQQQLKRVGIDASIKVVEDGYATLRKGPPGMHYYSFSLTLDPGYWFEWFTCPQVGKWNFWQWCNEEFDELKDRGDTTLDRAKREQIYIQMQKIIDEEVPAISVTNGASVHVSRKYIKPVYLGQYSQYQYFKKGE